MSIDSWEQDRERLESELRSEPYPSILQTLKRENPSFREFDSWDEVVAFMRTRSAKDPRTDDVLGPIFAACRDDRDPGWRTILLALFWRALERIRIFKSHWDADPEALWMNTMWAFLETIDRIDLQTRPDRLGQKIFNDTIHRLHDGYRREWDWENSIVDPSDRENEDDDEGKGGNRLETLMGGREAVEFDDVEHRHDQEAEITRLRGYVSEGLLAEPDLFLIIGTRIYGASLSEFVRDHGLDYETAKKRRQRAEATIRRVERNSRNI